MEPEYQEQRRRKGSRLFAILFVVVIGLVVVGAVTLFQRRAQYQALAKETETLAIPTVAVIHPATESAQEDLVLPGTMQAYVESPIYARTNGYLKKWYRDIGSRVRQGELLADIDTPEVNQQLSQARADLNTAKANAHLSEITATRFTELIKTDGVSKQEVDNANGDLEAKKAIVQSSEANVRRLEDLESFRNIYAPFSGVITRRNVDVGTRTLLTEVDVPNHNGALLPGGYAQGHLQVKVTGARLEVPVNPLLFRSEGLRAVVVDANHKTHLKPLTIGRDYGITLEVLQGLDANDWIVLKPADSLDEGQGVHTKEISLNAPPRPGPAGAPGSSGASPKAAPETKKP